MGASRGLDQALHAIALGKARRRRAAVLAGIEEAADQAGDRRNARVRKQVGVRALHRNRLHHVVAAARLLKGKAAEIVGGGVDQKERAVLAVELDAMTGAEEGGAAHLQAAARARRKGERERDAALRV